MSAIARLLRRLADRIDPVLPVAAMPSAPDAEGDSAERFLDDLVLRDALHRALNRYQPFRPPAQA